MNGVHDLGGTDGLGPVQVEDREPVWHSDWEKAAFAMFPANFLKGHFNLDEFRHGIEQMHPAEYLLSPYYEHWIHTVEDHVVAAGVVDAEELEARTQHYLKNPDEPLPDRRDPEQVALFEQVMRAGGSARRDSGRDPEFAIGDRVRVADDSPLGHTRRARYVRGKTGVIDLAHGTFIYPDSAANGLGEDPQHVYTVRFDAAQLWGEEAAEPNATVTFDVWEPYIEKA
ncbi:MAG TPA: nitrile hydratase subunit beta [Mycobacteriales bacterium]|nr:nitrile hydratase subunit beta [Mycobacteriales bacterium]